ncbi:MAG: imidazole glycerol phosphate synthase subunit HisF [Pirellulaceae bacterium]
MLTKRIIPCLDVRDGRVVKGVRFQNLRDAGDPAELAYEYEQQGADELVILDVSATNEGRLAMLETVQQVRNQIAVPLTVGGGIRSVDAARELLRAGADKVSVNTAAVHRPELIQEISNEFGAQCTVVAVDAKRILSTGGWGVFSSSGTRDERKDALQWCHQAQQLGAGEILLTSMDRDGTRTGFDCELLSAAATVVEIPVIASGGANSVRDMLDAFASGAHAVLAASIFHDGCMTVAQVKSELNKNRIPVRQ